MKILIVGNYREGTGWSRACVEMIRSLDVVGADVTCRNLDVVGNGQVVPSIAHLEKPLTGKYDVVIQHVLPHMMSFDGNFRLNVARYFTETTNFRGSNWPQSINLMDLALVSCKQSKKASVDSGVTIPTQVVPVSLDADIYQQSYGPPLGMSRDYRFTFYSIFDLCRRKNLFALLQAYFLEFTANDPVRLILKASVPGLSADGAAQHISEEIQKVKEGMKLYGEHSRYPDVEIICERLTDEEMNGLHQLGDCFVLPSYGEGACYPALDAMGFTNPVIATGCTAFQDYLTPQNGWPIDAARVPVFGETRTFQDLFSSSEDWFLPNIKELRNAMREAFANKPLRLSKGCKAAETVFQFNSETIGQQTLEVLEAALH